MSLFHEHIEKDLDQTFFNNNEFASEHNLNGKMVCCLIDKALIEEHDNQFEGVFKNVVTVHVSPKLFKKPVEGSLLRIDGSRHFVRSVSEEMGDLVIIAEASQQ